MEVDDGRALHIGRHSQQHRLKHTSHIYMSSSATAPADKGPPHFCDPFCLEQLLHESLAGKPCMPANPFGRPVMY
jgi:hypothetical protein